jgi:hypothetical protein
MDGQLEPMRGDLASVGVHLNTVSANEHVPEVERYIRTVKERVRSTYNTLPFKRMPALLVIEMVSSTILWLNSFPQKGGISTTMSPRAIVTGMTVDFGKHCQLEFGEYVQTHEEHDNSMNTRTIGALALRPTGNAQGGYFFMSLATGRRLNRHQWTRLPMPQEVIDRVHVLARRNPASPPGLVFGDRNGAIITLEDDASRIDDQDSDDDSTYVPGGDPASSSDDKTSDNEDADDDVSDDDTDGDEDDPPGGLDISTTDDDETVQPPNDTTEPPAANGATAGVPHEPIEMLNETEPDNNDDSGAIAEDNDEAAHRQLVLEREMDARYGPRSGPYGLRPRKPRTYEHLHTMHDRLDDPISNIALTQYGVNRGLKVFGEAGADTVVKELQQLHDRGVMKPKPANAMSAEER